MSHLCEAPCLNRDLLAHKDAGLNLVQEAEYNIQVIRLYYTICACFDKRSVVTAFKNGK